MGDPIRMAFYKLMEVLGCQADNTCHMLFHLMGCAQDLVKTNASSRAVDSIKEDIKKP